MSKTPDLTRLGFDDIQLPAATRGAWQKLLESQPAADETVWQTSEQIDVAPL